MQRPQNSQNKFEKNEAGGMDEADLKTTLIKTVWQHYEDRAMEPLKESKNIKTIHLWLIFNKTAKQETVF